MKFLSSFIIGFSILVFFSACSSKDIKKVGGNMISSAGSSSGGSPIGLVFLGAGGIVYGVGTLSETQEEKEAEEKLKSTPSLYDEESFDENNPVIIDTLKVQVSDVKYEVAQESNTTLNQE